MAYATLLELKYYLNPGNFDNLCGAGDYDADEVANDALDLASADVDYYISKALHPALATTKKKKHWTIILAIHLLYMKHASGAPRHIQRIYDRAIQQLDNMFTRTPSPGVLYKPEDGETDDELEEVRTGE